MAGSFLDSKTSFGHGFVDRSGKITQVDFPGATATLVLGVNNSVQLAGVWFGSGCKLMDQNCGFVAIPIKDCEKDKSGDNQNGCEDGDNGPDGQ